MSPFFCPSNQQPAASGSHRIVSLPYGKMPLSSWNMEGSESVPKTCRERWRTARMLRAEVDQRSECCQGPGNKHICHQPRCSHQQIQAALDMSVRITEVQRVGEEGLEGLAPDAPVANCTYGKAAFRFFPAYGQALSGMSSHNHKSNRETCELLV